MKKILLLIIPLILLTGCNKKQCIKSHKENSTCTRSVCMPNGKTVICLPQIYPCEKTICDEYKEMKE